MVLHLIRAACAEMRIPVWGIADVSRWKNPLFDPWIPDEFHPGSIFPETRSVLVIGLPVHLPVLETAPSIWYHEHYKCLNNLLDQSTYGIAEILNQAGYPSVSVPRDGYGSIAVLLKNPVCFFSHRHAAVLAGLGQFGMNNMVLTRAYGPRIRFGSVFTTAELPATPLITDDICLHCNRCVQFCPVQALEEGDYPKVLTNKQKCAERSADLFRHSLSPCGICIKVCPVGEDRIIFGRRDPTIYTRENTPYLRAWEHVQSYGSG